MCGGEGVLSLTAVGQVRCVTAGGLEGCVVHSVKHPAGWNKGSAPVSIWDSAFVLSVCVSA